MASPCCGAGGNLRWGPRAGDHPGVPAGAGGSHPRGLRSAGVSHEGSSSTSSPPPTPAHPLARTCPRTPACTHIRNTRQLALPCPTVAAARFQLGQPDTCSDSSFVRLEAPWQGSSQTVRFLRQQPHCAAAAAECTRLWRVDRGRLLLCRRQWTSEVSWVCQAGREPRAIHELGFSGRWPWCPR